MVRSSFLQFCAPSSLIGLHELRSVERYDRGDEGKRERDPEHGGRRRGHVRILPRPGQPGHEFWSPYEDVSRATPGESPLSPM